MGLATEEKDNSIFLKLVVNIANIMSFVAFEFRGFKFLEICVGITIEKNYPSAMSSLFKCVSIANTNV